jgi:predicted transcriptional regulator of viral defense system
MREVDTMRTERASALADGEIAALARRQHGVIARRQFHELGLGDRAVAHRIAVGRLHRLHRGVYAVGHTVLGPRGHWMAAVLACGPRAVLSHASAAALWELRAGAAARTDVTVPGTGGRRERPRVRIHRARDLDGQTTTNDGIPVTTPERTILDLAATLQRRRLERLVDRAETARLTDVASLDALARAQDRHRGAAKLRAALGTHTPGTTLTRSGLEERFLALCRDSGLPQPLVNETVAGLEVDFFFVDARLVIEADSWQHHRTRSAFERDRRRDATLARAGYRTLRMTHAQLTDEPGVVVDTLISALDDRRAA